MDDSQPTFVFVSHSSQNPRLTRAVCKKLVAALPAADGFRVLVDDQDLKPNQEWPRYLIEWMARCHSAVVLLTEEAIRSAWVLKEVTLLSARRAVDPSFTLFLVRFPDTDGLLERHGYGPLFLGNYQQVQFRTPTELVKEIHATLATRPEKATPFEDLVSRLDDLLERVGTNALRKVSGKLTQFGPLLLLQDERARLIDTIARHLVCGHLGGLKGVHDLVDHFNTSDAEVVRKILRLVSPYWVDASAALRLPGLLTCRPRRAAALNGSHVFDFTARMYVQRAHQPSKLFDIIPLAGGSHDDYVHHVTAEICGFMRTRQITAQASDAEIVAEVAKMDPEWYALLPTPVPDDDVLNEVMDLFPTVTFILWTGERLDRSVPLTRVEWLEPEVNLARERQERQNLNQAERVIERMQK